VNVDHRANAAGIVLKPRIIQALALLSILLTIQALPLLLPHAVHPF
jgi:hypothetical protein